MKIYRGTENGRQKSNAANYAYHAKFPDKRKRVYIQYRERTGYYIPTELHQLRVAQKRLERALATTKNGAEFCQPSERRCNQSIERRDRYGRSPNLRDFDAGTGPGDLS